MASPSKHWKGSKAVLQVDFANDGAVALIPDAAGELRGYRVRLVERGRRLMGFDVTKIANESTYTVRFFKDMVSCTCPDFRFNGFRKRELGSCKHVLGLWPLAWFCLGEHEGSNNNVSVHQSIASEVEVADGSRRAVRQR